LLQIQYGWTEKQIETEFTMENLSRIIRVLNMKHKVEELEEKQRKARAKASSTPHVAHPRRLHR